MELWMGDCLELMRNIPNESIDLIFCDLPYGTTECKWDAVIPFKTLWTQYNRIAKLDAAMVLTATQPFTTALIASNMRGFCHSWTWDKQFAANVMQAKRMPLQVCEDVLIFSRTGKTPRYFPIMTERDKPIKGGGIKNGESAPNRSSDEAKAAIRAKLYTKKYPISLLSFSNRVERGLHPTQKPVGLMEYLIRTYSNEGDRVLDNCMGSGTTGVACAGLDRRFIGIEQDEKYFRLAQERITVAVVNRIGRMNGEEDWPTGHIIL